MDAMKLNEVVELVTRQGETLQARRLRPADRQALRRFGESLSPTTTGVFLPHHYDDATLEPILRRSEAGDDLTLGVFRGSRIVGYFFLWYLDQAFPLLGIGLRRNEELTERDLRLVIPAGFAWRRCRYGFEDSDLRFAAQRLGLRAVGTRLHDDPHAETRSGNA